ncbi:hypothetical protein SCLARK_00591 [Spiroplasma clarkii]|uniref:Lipoprotein n=1 Tax=Spiroplasma clarkii TaxID=2139 RepID=A0A1Y0KZS5_9MOLU|nr:lipoprotein [Spiroplasma clarkii]ARU91262.1 hypothetical protein SCLARK_00591 [Spiroplasma clarkii]ATX70700.1 hypothetical protein SCLAR_v1c03700 [Spiroplasma clarkii]
MKKLLGLLAATGLVASTGSAVVACGEDEKTDITVTTESIKGKVDALLTDEEDLTVAELEALLDADETIVEVATWTVSRVGTTTNATIGFALAEGYELADGDTLSFTVTEILVSDEEDEDEEITVTTASIKDKVDALLTDKEDLTTVELKALLDADETIVEVDTWTVTKNDATDTSADIAFTLATGYKLADGDTLSFTVTEILVSDEEDLKV